jgi:hypothetical protein
VRPSNIQLTDNTGLDGLVGSFAASQEGREWSMLLDMHAKIERRISVAPMMDWTDRAEFLRLIRGLWIGNKARLLHVTSRAKIIWWHRAER